MCGLSHKKFDNFTNIPLFQIANPATVETSKSDRDSNHTSAIRPSIVGSHSAPIYHCHACSEKPSAPSVPQKTQALTLVLNGPIPARSPLSVAHQAEVRLRLFLVRHHCPRDPQPT